MALPTFINTIKIIPHTRSQTPFSQAILGCVHFHLLRPLGVGLEHVTYYEGDHVDSGQ